MKKKARYNYLQEIHLHGQSENLYRFSTMKYSFTKSGTKAIRSDSKAGKVRAGKPALN
jgi:hypothetical protein